MSSGHSHIEDSLGIWPQVVDSLLAGTITPGNLNSGGPTEKFLFVRKLPFRAAEESSGSWRGDDPEGLLHHDGGAAKGSTASAPAGAWARCKSSRIEEKAAGGFF